MNGTANVSFLRGVVDMPTWRLRAEAQASSSLHSWAQLHLDDFGRPSTTDQPLRQKNPRQRANDLIRNGNTSERQQRVHRLESAETIVDGRPLLTKEAGSEIVLSDVGRRERPAAGVVGDVTRPTTLHRLLCALGNKPE